MTAPTLNARYQRQQWLDDFTLPDGKPVAFDAGPALLATEAAEFRRLDAEIRKPSGRRDLGALARSAGLVEAEVDLFEVAIDRAEYLAWLPRAGIGADRAPAISEAELSAVRATHGVEAAGDAPALPTP